MFLNRQLSRLAGKTAFGVATLGLGGAGFLGAMHPALAADAIAHVQSLVTCGSTAACVSATNTNSGPGVAGKSTKGIGVSGTSTTLYGVMGSSSGLDGSGVRGEGSGNNSTGVSGYSPHGWGISGTSADGFGVRGSTGGKGTGVQGSSISGSGVAGRSNNAAAVFGIGAIGGDFSGSMWGIVSRGQGSGSYPLMILDEKNNALLSMRDTGALVGNAVGVGPYGTGADFSGSSIGVIARAPVNGYPLYVTDDYDNPLFSVDGSGNISYSGTMHGFAKLAGGAMVQSFSAKMTLPTVEDTGSAELVAGAAVIPLNPLFAASIDARSGYRVFLTPSGDTRGLFVAARNMNGFMVRESQGGKATVSFDYRIVATAAGHTGERMSVIRAASAMARAMKPIVPATAASANVAPSVSGSASRTCCPPPRHAANARSPF